MKFKILAMLLGMSLFAFSAYATTYTINDNWVNWPGYSNGTWDDTNDDIGDPEIEQMLITVDDFDILQSVQLVFNPSSERITYDSLFLNSYNMTDTGTAWDSWDYMIRDGEAQWRIDQLGALDNGLYSVANDYSYTLATTGREGNPNGIATDDLSVMSGIYSVDYTSFILSYELSALNINVSDGFFVAYSPYCANDVIGGPAVPEPATLILLGVGLAGLAFYRRKQ